ncbi:MAG: hypothetical protein MZU97_04965 [Bacillus subtilis]|nr:hypothetical protein [Bacillus subtilis]
MRTSSDCRRNRIDDNVGGRRQSNLTERHRRSYGIRDTTQNGYTESVVEIWKSTGKNVGYFGRTGRY